MLRQTSLSLLILVALLGAALSGPALSQQSEFPVPPGRIVAGDDAGLFTMLTDGTTKTYLAQEEEVDCWLRDGVWSPDGSQIMYTAICGGEGPGDWLPDPDRTDLRQRTAQVMVVDPLSGATRTLVPGDGVSQDYAGDWHPDGDQVVIYSNRDATGVFNLYLYDLTEGALTQLTTFDSNVSRVSFNPAGSHLLYNRRIVDTDDIRHEVRALDLATRSEVSVAQGFTPAWSRDGRWIAFATEGEVSDVFVMPADCIIAGGGCDATAQARNITNSPGVAEREPVFSPDQTQLVYVRDTDGELNTLTWDIFRHDLRTGLHTNLTNTPGSEERHRGWEAVPAVEPVDVATVLPVVARVRTAEGAANLRAEPTTNGAIVGVLPRGTLLIVQGALEDRTWYRVTLPEDSAQAWIYHTLLDQVAGDLAGVPDMPR
jgi:Tol biopolymer transport system component